MVKRQVPESDQFAKLVALLVSQEKGSCQIISEPRYRIDALRLPVHAHEQGVIVGIQGVQPQFIHHTHQGEHHEESTF